MKKTAALPLVLLLFLFGCAASPAATLPESGHTGSIDWGLTLSVEDVTPTKLTLVMSQSGKSIVEELTYGSPFWLSVWEDGRWQAVPQLPEASEVAWTDLAYILPPGNSTQETLNWDWLYGELPPGIYRVCRDFTGNGTTTPLDTETYWAVFELPAE